MELVDQVSVYLGYLGLIAFNCAVFVVVIVVSGNNKDGEVFRKRLRDVELY